MEIEVLFAKLAVKNKACSKEQVEEALARLTAGGLKASALPGAMVELGYLNEETSRKILDFIDDYLAGQKAGPKPTAGRNGGATEDDASGTMAPEIVFVCVECKREIPPEEVKSGAALVLYGESYCANCLSDALKLVRLQDARHARSSRKLKASAPPETRAAQDPPKPEAAPPEELEQEPGEIILPADLAAEKRRLLKQKQAQDAAAASPTQATPPPLPKVSSVEELSEEELKEIEKLLSRGREELAVSRLAKKLDCSQKDAQAALDRLKAEILSPASSGSKGLFGFARNLRRSSSFSLNVWRKNWARVVEEGEAWLAEEPENPELLTQVGIAYREQGKLDRAEKTLRRAVAAKGAGPDSTRQLGLVLSAAGKHSEALEKFEGLQSSGAAASEDLRALAAAAAAAGAGERALPAIEKLLASSPPDALELVDQQMGILYRAGRFEEAFRNHTALLKLEKKPYEKGFLWGKKLAAELPADPRVWRQLSRIHERRGELDLALSALDEAEKVGPGDPRTLERMASLRGAAGETGAALRALENLLKAAPEDHQARRRLAELYRRAGGPEKAAEAYRQCADAGALAPEDAVCRAKTLLDLGRKDEAAAVLEPAASSNAEAAELLSSLKTVAIEDRIDSTLRGLLSDPPGYRGLLELATGFLERGMTSSAVTQGIAAAAAPDGAVAVEAAAFLEKIFESRPQSRRLAFFLAGHYAAKNEPLPAARALERFLETNPDDAEAKRTLLELRLSAGAFAEGLALVGRLQLLGEAFAADVEKALSRIEAGLPGAHEPLLAYGRFLEGQGRLAEALAKYGKYLELDPGGGKTSPAAMARLLRATGDQAGLLTWLGRCVEADPGDLLSRLELSRGLLGRGDFDQAEKHLKAILETDPQNRTAGALLESLEKSRREQQLAELEKNYQADPSNTALGLELGKALLSAGRKEDGLKIYLKCRSDQQTGWKALEALYSSYRADGESQKALACLKELMPRRRPARDSREWKEIMYRMGDLYLSLSEPVRAGRVFFDILKVDPNFRDVKSMMELVEIMEELVDPAGGHAASWFLGIGGAVKGPLKISSVKEMIDKGDLSADDLVWQPGFSAWKRALDADKIGLLFKYRDRL